MAGTEPIYGYYSNSKSMCGVVRGSDLTASPDPQELEADKIIETLDKPRSEENIRNLLQQIRTLAEEITLLYPWQDIRQARPYLLSEKDSPKDIFPSFVKDFPLLVEKKEQFIAVFAVLCSINPAGLAPGIRTEVERLQQARSFFDLLQTAAGISLAPRKVAVAAADGRLQFTIDIKPFSDAVTMLSHLDDSPRIGATADSTSKEEAAMNKGGLLVSAVTSLWSGKTSTSAVRPFNFYADVYGVDRNSTPPGLAMLRARLQKEFSSVVANPSRVYIGDFALRYNGPNSATLAPTLVDRYIDLDQDEPILQFLHEHRAAYEKAARLLQNSLAQAGTRISYETLVLFLMINTYEELFWIGNEDPWQDRGAANWSGAKEAGDYNRQYQRYSEMGLAFGVNLPDGKAYDLPWRIASLKVPIDKQGFGPNAVIIGDFLAAGDTSLWNYYFPGLQRDQATAAQIALDPDLSIKATALVYDANIRKLGATIFSNPLVRMPDNTYPFIQDRAKSREYFVLSWTRYIKAFPEVAANFPDYFPYGHHSWNPEFLDTFMKVMSGIMQLPDSLPDLDLRFIPSKGTSATDYFGDRNDPQVSDALIAVTVPKE